MPLAAWRWLGACAQTLEQDSDREYHRDREYHKVPFTACQKSQVWEAGIVDLYREALRVATPAG